MSEQNAQLNAASVLILDAITKDPTQFVMVQDGQIVPNPSTVSWLLKNAGLATKEALWNARQERETQAQKSRTAEAGNPRCDSTRSRAPSTPSAAVRPLARGHRRGEAALRCVCRRPALQGDTRGPAAVRVRARHAARQPREDAPAA